MVLLQIALSALVVMLSSAAFAAQTVSTLSNTSASNPVIVPVTIYSTSPTAPTGPTGTQNLTTVTLSTTSSADIAMISAPCASGPTTAAGLRSCSVVIPSTVSQINSMMQIYGGCYYQGIDLDTSIQSKTQMNCSTTGGTSSCSASAVSCQGPNFGLACSLVPNTFNNNTSEAVKNVAGKSCGLPQQISVSIASCPNNIPNPTAQQSQFLQAQNLSSATALDGLDAASAQALLSKAQAGPSPVVGANPPSGKQICISLDATGLDSTGGNGSMERSYFKGAYIQALAYYATQVANQITCSHSITVQTAGACQSFANQVAALGATTQTTISTLQSMLGNQFNVSDIDNAFLDSTASIPSLNSSTIPVDPGSLRQSAQHLSSARSGLEAAFTQLAMCSIFSQAQASWLANAGPAVQASVLAQMDQDLDPSPPTIGPLRAQCGKLSSISKVQACLNQNYQTQMQSYLTNRFSTLWPTQTVLTPNTCPAGGTHGSN